MDIFRKDPILLKKFIKCDITTKMGQKQSVLIVFIVDGFAIRSVKKGTETSWY